MSEPVSSATVLAGGLMGASVFGLATGTDYGVVFGAFAGAVFYVATAINIGRIRLVAYFITSFIVGVLGAGLIGTKLAAITHYEKPLDALGGVLEILCHSSNIQSKRNDTCPSPSISI
ncbi:putative holin, partial [Salmonella enterica]|uniref:putative holin n=1 Tax=Salmonella enterica TaxID=28901 RepID=UPI00070F73E5